jgi:phage replication O-like protein O
MASPQKENGYTGIANEILERVVKTALLGSEYKILFFVLRKTYGYHKIEDKISLTQFEEGTELSRVTVVKSLKNLIIKNILIKRDQSIYKFNKDYDSWVVKTALLVKHNDSSSKDRFTKIGKADYTHNRKKKIQKKDRSLNYFSIKDIPDNLNGELFYKNKYFYVTHSLKNEMIKGLPTANLNEEILRSEFYKMETWLDSDKPKKDYKRFLVNWLSNMNQIPGLRKNKSENSFEKLGFSTNGNEGSFTQSQLKQNHEKNKE